jgi:hypothetical protein
MKHKGILVIGAIVAAGVLITILAMMNDRNTIYYPPERPPAEKALRCRGSEMQMFAKGHWYLLTDCSKETQLTLAATPLGAVNFGGPKTCGSGVNACGKDWPWDRPCCYYPLVNRD